jgi:hypothetical protein
MKLLGSMKKNSEQTTQSFSPSVSKSQGEILFKGGRSIAPTFHLIKLCQARSAVGYIFGKFSQGKDFCQFKLA